MSGAATQHTEHQELKEPAASVHTLYSVLIVHKLSAAFLSSSALNHVLLFRVMQIHHCTVHNRLF